MASVSMPAEALEEEDEEPTSLDDLEKTESQRVQENVSFQTLSRLSTWAAEAKMKLRRSTSKTIKEEQEAVSDTFQGDATLLLHQALQKANISVASPNE